MHPFPETLSTLLGASLLGPWASARLFAEVAEGARPLRGEQSVGDFLRRRLGSGPVRALVEPLVRGVYGADLDRLSLVAAFPQFKDIVSQRQSLLLAAARAFRRRNQVGRSDSLEQRLLSFWTGNQWFVDRLADSLGSQLRLQSPVEGVWPERGQWRVEVGGPEPTDMLADVVVAATPASESATYLGHLDAAFGQTLAAMPRRPVVAVGLGYRDVDMVEAPRGFGYFVPSRQESSVLGVAWASRMFPRRRSPEGTSPLQVVFDGDGIIRETDDDQIVVRAHYHLGRVLGLQGTPLFRSVSRHPQGIPQYGLGHLDRLAALRESLASLPGIFLAGSAFFGIGINACTADAERVTEAVAAFVEGKERSRSSADRQQGKGTPVPRPTHDAASVLRP